MPLIVDWVTCIFFAARVTFFSASNASSDVSRFRSKFCMYFRPLDAAPKYRAGRYFKSENSICQYCGRLSASRPTTMKLPMEENVQLAKTVPFAAKQTRTEFSGVARSGPRSQTDLSRRRARYRDQSAGFEEDHGLVARCRAHQAGAAGQVRRLRIRPDRIGPNRIRARLGLRQHRLVRLAGHVLSVDDVVLSARSATRRRGAIPTTLSPDPTIQAKIARSCRAASNLPALGRTQAIARTANG